MQKGSVTSIVHNALAVVLFAGLVVFPALAGDGRVTSGPKKGALVIVGGGELNEEITSRFVALAGGSGGNFVVIPTASGDNQLTPARVEQVKAQFMKRFAVKNVTILHTRDRNIADSKTFVEPLRRASAVWFPGGRQWRLADAYLNTRTEREISAVLARGGVVGGSSAGATILGSYLLRGASAMAGNPDGDNTILMAPGHEVGFGLLRNATVDQHIIARHRENDLPKVIAAHPGLLGIGIDESTAIVVQGERFEVIGKSKVSIVDGKDHGGKGYYMLSHGQKFNLKKRVMEPLPAASEGKAIADQAPAR